MKCFVFLLVLFPSGPALSQAIFDRDQAYDKDFETGVPIGDKIPSFAARDQNGKNWDFDAIKGPKGAVLLFYRSADW